LRSPATLIAALGPGGYVRIVMRKQNNLDLVTAGVSTSCSTHVAAREEVLTPKAAGGGDGQTADAPSTEKAASDDSSDTKNISRQ
jgi:hypothetical protein